jgi:hypothetical protein
MHAIDQGGGKNLNWKTYMRENGLSFATLPMPKKQYE